MSINNVGNNGGLEAEEKFQTWLNKHNIPYFRIDQKVETRSLSLLNIFDAKRPDFILLVPRIGFMLVDVKKRTNYKLNHSFDVNKEDLDKYINLEKNFNFKLWFAFYDETLDKESFYWIKLQETEKIMQADTIRVKSGRRHPIYRIPIANCQQILFDESIEAITNKLISFDPENV